MENKLKVGITQGDINSISYEIIIKMLADNKMNEICVPILYGSSKVAAYYRKMFDMLNFNLSSIGKPSEANDKRPNVINFTDDELKVEVGKETQESVVAAMKTLTAALEDLDAGELNTLTMAPQTASSYTSENMNSLLDYISSRYNQDVMKLLVGQKMKVGFVTSDLPLQEVSRNLTTEKIISKLKVLNSTLKTDFTIRKPRIAVLALNPVKNTGFTGVEEQEIILPAIEAARNSGIMALGPYSVENLFIGTNFEKFDAILALHNEQGMLPFKTIEGIEGTILLAGLDKVITTTVTGTAFDIAGQGIADEAALRNAMYLGIDVYNNRYLNRKLVANPLPHYDSGGNSYESDMNVDQIVGLKEF
ncbi:MAG: 4-hydroxythreonine-4-phosphate dehydrogenase PdxA [Culturomica sp.]|jgi:4-hydroxythreonine-4-phosphate dehydrogenase|nr:4-hydroxythreonine-4-phosphate dehydrogenase PdxA [Culturomica sp.]